MSQSDWLAIMRGEDQSLKAAVCRGFMASASLPYGVVIQIRNLLYNYGLCGSQDLKRTTFSIGNITTGGTGKTPMVIELTRRLRALEAHPAILLRGHKAGATGSDEALLLENELGSRVPVQADPDRVRGAAAVLARRPDVDVFILDDGFQHRRVRRNLDLVLIDATNPFGMGHMLPRGLLREPRPNLRRAGAVIVTRADQVDVAALRQLDETLLKITGRPPIAHAAHTWRGFRDGTDQSWPLTLLSNTKTQGVCGIGNPQAFGRTLLEHSPTALPLIVFPDHHAYTATDLSSIVSKAQAAGAEAIITTDKDWVKWKPLLSQPPVLPIYRPELKLAFLDGSDAFDALLRQTIGPAA